MTKKKGKLEISHEIVLILGALVFALCSWQAALLYLLVSLLGTLWFLKSICPHCLSYGTELCQSGYGLLSSKLFKRPEKTNFKRAFKRNIWVVALQWFLPLLGGIYCLYLTFDYVLLALIIIFVLIAFVWLPTRSKKEGCARCPQRHDCAWTKVGKS